MKKRSYFKDINRTLKNNRSRFVALVVMVALGTGVFTGFAAGCMNAFQSADRFYKAQNTYDIMLVSTLGLTKEDLAAVSEVEGIAEMFGNRSMDVKFEQSNGDSLLANLSSLDNHGMNEPYVLEGVLPTKAGQVAVNSKFMEDTGLQLGDIITLTKAETTDKAADTSPATVDKSTDIVKDEESSLDITIDSDSSEPVLAISQYEITAVILSPLDIANKEDSLAAVSFSTSSSDYLLFALEDCIDSDIYTSIYLTLEGAEELDSYSNEYQTLTKQVISEIEAKTQTEREQLRFQQVVSDAEAKIVDAEALLADKMAEAEQKLTDAQADINSGWADVEEGREEIKVNERKLNKGELTLAEGKLSAQEKLKNAQREINSKLAEMKAGEAELIQQEASALEQFEGYEQEIKLGQLKLDEQKSEAEDQLNITITALRTEAGQIWNGIDTQKVWSDMIADGVKAAPYLVMSRQGETPTKEQTNDYNEAMAALQNDTQKLAVSFVTGGAALSQEQVNTFQTLAVNYGTLEYSRTVSDAKALQLANEKEAALAQISESRQKINDGKEKLANGQKELDDNRTETREQLAQKQEELEEGRLKLEAAKQELEEAAEKLEEGQFELDHNRSDYEASIQKAKQKLSDAKAEVADITMTKWYLWDRGDNESFAGLDSDISFLQEITKAFPLIFFLVAILISLTTMTRMVEEDRGLIGTYKSLGYSKLQISYKYIFYSVLACLAGGLFGSVLGFYGLPKIIEIIVGTLYKIPNYQLSFYPSYGLGGFGLFLIGIVGATVISCAEMLHKRPAELMRPKAPKAGSRILLERVPFLWKRLGFLSKVTCRNLFRYKKRALMTIVGILGCTMLIVFAFGIRNTVGGLMPDQFDTITVYDAIVVTDDLNEEQNKALTKEWKSSEMIEDSLQIQTTALTLHSGSDSMELTAMIIPDGTDLEPYIHLFDVSTSDAKTLPSDSIVVTKNAAKQLKLDKGDVISLQSEDHKEQDYKIAFVAENYAGNYIYMSDSCYRKAFGEYQANALLLNLTKQAKDLKWLDTLSEDERILTVSNNEEVRNTFGDVNRIVNMVVYLLIGMSAVLAVAVLFTLSNINISERERELATVKVLGFLPKEVFSYVNKETFILTILGILLGMPAGYGITYAILSNVSIADVAFRVRVSVGAYLIAAFLTLVFALSVNHISNKSLRKINMVEALKSVE